MVFSDRITQLQPSVIREILKAPDDPDIISFAAGNPSPETFPVGDMARLSAELYADGPQAAFQYGITEGYGPLREQTAAYLKDRWSIGNEGDELIITSGGQQAIELAAKVLCNEDDSVLCEENSFIGALNAFRSYKLKLCGVKCDGQGMVIEALEEKIKNAVNPKIIYTIPTFHNPAGSVLAAERRTAMLELAAKYNLYIIEDSPYCELRYEGETVAPVKRGDASGRVIYAGSYSKTVAPGIRVGYALARRDIIAKMTVAKQVSDVHSNLFFQILISRYLGEGLFDRHIDFCRSLYRAKRDAMASALRRMLGDSVSFVEPAGGLFLWLGLPEGREALEVCAAAKAKKLLCVPGNAFAIDEKAPSRHIRLNFSLPGVGQIEKGVERLAEVLRGSEE